MTLVALNILAFLLHTVLSLKEAKYRLLRAKLPTRKIFFQHLNALTTYLCFENYGALLDFRLRGLEIPFEDSG